MKPIPFPSPKPSNQFEYALVRSKIFKLIKDRSFGRGEITLASGRKSDFYFDMKPTMLHPEGAALLAELIFQRLEGIKVDYIGGLEMGAVPLLAPVSALSFNRDRPIPSFFVRKTIKDHGTMKLIEGTDDLKGKNVVILDDVTTSGESAMIAVRAAKAAGAKIVLVLTIVDRGEGAAKLYADAGVPFDCLFSAKEFLEA